ncbi:MAG: ATP-binding protein [Acidobacteriota bacterium]
MSNYLKLLEGDLEQGRSAEARERLDRVREGLDRAAAVVRRVLTFSDPARAPREDLPDIESVREAVEFLQPRFPNVEITIVTGNGRGMVRANRVALGQLFLNILLNASEVQEDGGKIEVDVHEYNATVMVTISDRGPGLAEEALDHLFEPFFSTRGSRGLGLAVCHGIVQEHGGEIEARNAPDGKGAVFEVRLPKSSSSLVEES